MLSDSIQNYLKAIYSLNEDGKRVSTNALAERLEVSAASVSGMIKKLDELKLVMHAPYQGVQLTPTGRKMALEIIRHHRLIELYLTEAMGFPWDRVHAEAERLEHAISEEFEDRIAHILGDPTHDPHGDPIPSKDGDVRATSRTSLAETAAGSSVCIERVRDEEPETLRALASFGLRPKTQLRVISNPTGANVIEIAIGEAASVSVPRELGGQVFVTPI